jgi:phosphoglycerate dehydrogenase-like enzyme
VSCAAAIGLRMAEFTSSLIFLSLKQYWRHVASLHAERNWNARWPVAGAVDSTVGLISLGYVGRSVVERLASTDLRIVAYDPYADRNFVRRNRIHLLELDEIFEVSDVVSIHTPLLPETERLIGRDLLSQMKLGATLINTARGAVIDHAALLTILRDRPDLFALLDVTSPEPPPQDWELFELPNVIVSPHISGNIGRERRVLGSIVAEEVARFCHGERLRYAVSKRQFTHSA